MMTFEEMVEAVNEAARIQRMADKQIGDMARMVSGKLRSADVSSYTLRQLKRELRDFNIHTCSWKELS